MYQIYLRGALTRVGALFHIRDAGGRGKHTGNAICGWLTHRSDRRVNPGRFTPPSSTPSSPKPNSASSPARRAGLQPKMSAVVT